MRKRSIDAITEPNTVNSHDLNMELFVLIKVLQEVMKIVGITL
jgi:hypothetical protein